MRHPGALCPFEPTPLSRQTALKQYRLVLWIGDGEKGPIFDGRGTFDEVLSSGALAALENIDPYTAGIYLAATGTPDQKLRALTLIRHAIERDRIAEPNVLYEWIGLSQSDVTRRLLALGNALAAGRPRTKLQHGRLRRPASNLSERRQEL